MKTLRQLLLSVLLSAFSFFVVHDYVMTDVDTDTQYELCLAQSSTGALDLPTKIHEHIHSLMSIPEALPLPDADRPVALRSHTAAQQLHSYISPVPSKPPLA
ncbi:hypothetical protein LOH54_00260 [Sulfurimonas sp. HSL-3221]|uniref:hypothetical protein n=1 Tax=Sulfurimonadaceae TaxID=2771471 RepID=UPI001E5C924B|nr:hypothetical protein [Sulfurimonas sp. HSL-3221]UFS62581.1 hypothetical protein LOH54_00260 [Sulfurimonas sp. HSL-3221]